MLRGWLLGEDLTKTCGVGGEGGVVEAVVGEVEGVGEGGAGGWDLVGLGGNCSSGGEEGPVNGIEEVKIGGRD